MRIVPVKNLQIRYNMNLGGLLVCKQPAEVQSSVQLANVEYSLIAKGNKCSKYEQYYIYQQPVQDFLTSRTRIESLYCHLNEYDKVSKNLVRKYSYSNTIAFGQTMGHCEQLARSVLNMQLPLRFKLKTRFICQFLHTGY